MKKFILFILLSMLVQGCNSQKTRIIEKQPVTFSTDSVKPQVDIRVNKKYDDKGNLLQFDSTYSYVFSSPGGKTQQLNSDSFYSQFKTKFYSQYEDWLNNNFNPIFYSDSLFKYDFLNKDYFDKRFELNKPRFHELFREMDSLKNEMLKRHYPDGKMKPKLL